MVRRGRIEIGMALSRAGNRTQSVQTSPMRLNVVENDRQASFAGTARDTGLSVRDDDPSTQFWCSFQVEMMELQDGLYSVPVHIDRRLAQGKAEMA